MFRHYIVAEVKDMRLEWDGKSKNRQGNYPLYKKVRPLGEEDYKVDREKDGKSGVK